MDTLVQSTTAWVVSLRPEKMKEEQTDLIVSRLAEILELDEEYIYGRLELPDREIKLRSRRIKARRMPSLTSVITKRESASYPASL